MFKKGNQFGKLNKGIVRSKNTRKKIGKSVNKRYASGEKFGFQKGHKSYSKKGQFTSERMKGKNNPNWKGGISRKNKTERQYAMYSQEYKQWRIAVFERDNWTCQGCGIRGCYLEAHHIKEWAKYPELRFVVSNGVALCQDCHNLTKKARYSNVQEVSQ